jgi:hypothetical protein
LIFVSAGNGTWLSFLLATIGLLFVSLNINQFARRSASPGSLYTYIVKGLGPAAGVLSGWGLLLGYMATGMSTLCGFAIFSRMLLVHLGVHAPILTLFAVGSIVSYGVAYKDIQLSAKLMLAFEGLSILFILVSGAAVWMQKGFAIDMAQVTLQGAKPAGVITGILLVIFSFSGFESSTSLGDEAKDPLRAIPRSLLQSTALSGGFFLLMAYLIILAFKDSGVDLGKTEAPLTFLASWTGLDFLGTLINLGAVLSFFPAPSRASTPRHGYFFRWRSTACCTTRSVKPMQGIRRLISPSPYRHRLRFWLRRRSISLVSTLSMPKATSARSPALASCWCTFSCRLPRRGTCARWAGCGGSTSGTRFLEVVLCCSPLSV